MQTEQSPQEHLVRGLTHRMNNILTLFHGYVGMMLENQQLDMSTREGLRKIKDGASAASDLMDRTHSLVRNPSLVWRDVDLAEFLPLTASSFHAMKGERTRMEFAVPEDCPKLRTDLNRLKTALVELVRNACEATIGGGTVRIEVTAHKGDAFIECVEGFEPRPAAWVAISVIDDGPGIPTDAERRMFQPFFSTKKKPTATGLGLNVVDGCLRQIGGILRHESRPGSTRFQILLPAVDRTALASEP